MNDNNKQKNTGSMFKEKLDLAMRALKHRNYKLFISGQFVSITGTWIQNIAQSWLVYRLTGSAVLLGAVSFSMQIPVFLFSPIGGIVADKYNRHRILIIAQTISMILAFIFAALTLMNIIKVWHVFVLAAMLGIVNGFEIPARQAFVVDIVGKEDLLNAIALNSSTFNAARILGPAIAGVMVGIIGEGWCFFANGISYIAVIIGLFMMKIKEHTRVPLPGSALASIAEGFRYVIKTGPVRSLLLLLGLVSLTGMPYLVLMPIFADKILHVGANGLGLLTGASGIGALTGALCLAVRQDLRGLGKWVAYSSMGMGTGLMLFASSHFFWLSIILLMPVGFSMMIVMASSNTLIQSMIPDELRGRVMAVFSMTFMGMAPLGALTSGALAEHFGSQITVAGGGLICVIGSLIFLKHLPVLRHEARQLIIALQVAGGEPAEEITGEGSVVL